MPLPQVEIDRAVSHDARRRRRMSHATGGGRPSGFFDIASAIIKAINWPLIIVVAVLVSYGLLVCWSAVQGDEDYNFSRQVMGVAAGIVLMIVVWAFDYRHLAAATWPLLIITCVLVLSPHLPIIGRTVQGATSWIYIGTQIQPGEFAKVTVVLFAASLVARYEGKLSDLTEYCKCVGLLLVPFLCIMTQPDLGTGLVYLFIGATALVMGGARAKYLLISLGVFILLIVAVFFLDELLKYETESGSYEYRLIKQYQRARLLVFMNQDSPDYTDEAYNLKQAMIAIGSGGLFGKGLGSSTQSSFGFLPEAPTDFIFCVLAEEMGFIGVLGLIALFAALIIVVLHIARTCGNLFGMLIVCSIVGMWLFQILENIGMCCGLMPITGIPLPFVSYGSSFMIVNFVMLGLVGSVYSHNSGI